MTYAQQIRAVERESQQLLTAVGELAQRVAASGTSNIRRELANGGIGDMALVTAQRNAASAARALGDLLAIVRHPALREG
jgi:hypothetical protein